MSRLYLTFFTAYDDGKAAIAASSNCCSCVVGRAWGSSWDTDATVCPVRKARPPLENQRLIWAQVSIFFYLDTIILVGFAKFQLKISKYMSKRNFFLFSKACSRDCDLKIRDWVSARVFENHFRIPSRGYLMVQRFFQNFNFEFFSTSMKFPKKSKKI